MKVLVVDNHPLMQQVLFGVLSELGPKLQVLQSANWDDALELANTRDELELVLMVRRRVPLPRCDSPAHPYREVELTQRQRQVLALLVEGKPNKIISRELGLAEGTVKIHINGIFKALKVSNRTQAVIAASRLAVRLGDAAAKSEVTAPRP